MVLRARKHDNEWSIESENYPALVMQGRSSDTQEERNV